MGCLGRRRCIIRKGLRKQLEEGQQLSVIIVPTPDSRLPILDFGPSSYRPDYPHPRGLDESKSLFSNLTTYPSHLWNLPNVKYMSGMHSDTRYLQMTPNPSISKIHSVGRWVGHGGRSSQLVVRAFVSRRVSIRVFR
jgi:hypothetical protein